VITKFRGSERSDLDAGAAGDAMSNMLMDLVMEMAAAATAIATETAGVTRLEPMDRNVNRKRRKRSGDWANPRDWRSRMERTLRQQEQELTQLH
jgi:hypothetical protein